jgi:gamma-glutamyl-gamma-aminobutyrate hydrolase PuuD
MSLNGKLILGYMPGGTGTMRPFNQTFDIAHDVTIRGFDNVDALVLWGGEDICPSYYNQKPHSENDKQNGPSSRDKREWAAMKYARMHNIPIIGVCRGAQFLCVFSEGTLVQHVNGHQCGTHMLEFADDSLPKMSTTSCHHQMMYPWETDYQLLAWNARPNRSTVYEGENDREITGCVAKVEPEVVYFPKTRGLAIQGHPEWMQDTEPFVQYCNRMVQELLLGQKAVVTA